MRDILYRACVLPDIDEYHSTLLIIDHFHPAEGHEHNRNWYSILYSKLKKDELKNYFSGYELYDIVELIESHGNLPGWVEIDESLENCSQMYRDEPGLIPDVIKEISPHGVFMVNRSPTREVSNNYMCERYTVSDDPLGEIKSALSSRRVSKDPREESEDGADGADP